MQALQDFLPMMGILCTKVDKDWGEDLKSIDVCFLKSYICREVAPRFLFIFCFHHLKAFSLGPRASPRTDNHCKDFLNICIWRKVYINKVSNCVS